MKILLFFTTWNDKPLNKQDFRLELELTSVTLKQGTEVLV